MKRKDYEQALQEGHLKCCNEVVNEQNILDYGLDDGSMTLMFQDDDYYVINYNEYGNSLHFINVVDKSNNKIVETVEV